MHCSQPSVSQSANIVLPHTSTHGFVRLSLSQVLVLEVRVGPRDRSVFFEPVFIKEAID